MNQNSDNQQNLFENKLALDQHASNDQEVIDKEQTSLFEDNK